MSSLVPSPYFSCVGRRACLLVGCPKDSVPIVPWRTGGMSYGLCPYGPMEDRWDVLRTLSYCPTEDRWDVLRTLSYFPMEDRWDVLWTLSPLSHGGQVGCPKDSVP